MRANEYELLEVIQSEVSLKTQMSLMLEHVSHEFV